MKVYATARDTGIA